MSEIERYIILVEGGPPSNYSAWSSEVPGCVATGATIDECVQSMHEALAGHFEVMREHGEVVPPPTAQVAVVQVAP